MKKCGLKLFVVKKYVMAESVADALRKERSVNPDAVWVEERFPKGERDTLTDAIGFQAE